MAERNSSCLRGFSNLVFPFVSGSNATLMPPDFPPVWVASDEDSRSALRWKVARQALTSSSLDSVQADIYLKCTDPETRREILWCGRQYQRNYPDGAIFIDAREISSPHSSLGYRLLAPEAIIWPGIQLMAQMRSLN